MTRKRSVSRPVRMLLLSAAISVALLEQAHAQSSPFARRGANPGADAARTVQRQGLQSVQATQMAQKSLQAFQRAAQLRASLDAAQAAARAAAAASQIGNDVPDGLAEGGLKVVGDVQIDPGAIKPNDPRLGWNNVWLGAKGPTQTVADGKTEVTIEQTQHKAILNWETFNVGKSTTVTFDQSAGGAQATQWIALNRVHDPNAAPSRILGNIKAEGQVYILNRNGVMFGGTSQVNTHSLLASSLDLFSADVALSNQKFITQGLRGGQAGSDVLTGVQQLQAGRAPGDIKIEAGARITTGAGGYSLLAGANVDNAGTISAQDGQAMLLAGLGARRDPNTTTTNNLLPLSFENFSVSSDIDLSGIGKLTNTGIVSSKRGDATLVGYRVEQQGVVTATTSISRPGSISLLAIDQTSSTGSGAGTNNYFGGILELGKDSVTSILPEYDGETTTSSNSADKAFVPPSMTLAGAQVGFRGNSLVLAPGATVDVLGLGSNPSSGAQRPVLDGRILMESGSTINVAGLADVQLDMSSNLVDIPRIGNNELADSPQQRDGALYRQQVVFDRRDQGVRQDGVNWVGSPLLNALGYVDQVSRKIDEMLINGGTVNIVGRDFVMQKGAKIDLDGGFLHFLGGMVQTQRLLGGDGRIYDLSTADPMLNYRGFAGEQRVDHSRWNVSETYGSPLVGTRSYYESDYVQGGNAGTLNIEIGLDNAAQDKLGALVLDGDLSARAISGRYQIKFGREPKDGALNIGSNSALLNKAFFNPVRDRHSWQVSEERSGLSDQIDMDTPVASLPGSGLAPQDPNNPGFWSTLSTEMVREAGFGTVTINSSGVVAVDSGANLQVADGGRIALTAGRVDVQGQLTAHSGDIALTSMGGEVYLAAPGQEGRGAYFGRGDVMVGTEAKLDVSGNWVNDDSLQVDQQVGKTHIDGGSITLSARQRSFTGDDGVERDASGSVRLENGAVLDASGGGYIDASGKLTMRDGRPLGAGGDIALQTYVRDPNESSPTYVVNLPTLDDSVGRLQFQDATLLSDGFAGGGTLSLRAFGIQIGGEAPQDGRLLHLDGGFFDGKGFGGYDLSAETDATIVAGTQVRVSQRNLVPDINALRRAATGTDIHAGVHDTGSNAYVSLGQLDAFYRPATDFSMRAGDYLGLVAGNPTGDNQVSGSLLLGEGAHLLLDAGAKAQLSSRGQVTVLGDITAHGGDITLSSTPPILSQGQTGQPGSVWVGAESRLDVSGIALIDPLAPMRPGTDNTVRQRDGKVLDGGSITLSNNGGYVVVEEGAQLDLSGARATFDLPTDVRTPKPGTDTLQPRDVWSNGGTLTLASAGGLFFDGSISAAGGDASARGGELHLVPLSQDKSLSPDALSAKGIIFEQSGSRLPDGARPGDVLEPGLDKPSGLLYFAADRLKGSGIDTLVAGNQTPTATDTETLVPIAFSGDVDLSVSRAIVFNAPLYTMLPAGSSDLSAAGTDNTVHLSAAYVGLNGYRPRGGATPALPTLAQPGDTSLIVDADHIDLGGQFALSNVGEATFNSRGDIRFHTPAAYAFNLDGSARLGEMLTAGDLTFKASQVYPASGEGFLVRAVGAIDSETGARADTKITVLPNGNSSVPLSAGGSLFFDATEIEQHGTIRAPGGRIVLGITDPADAATRALFGNRDLAATRSVRVADGSLTSVSLEGAVLPYGTTIDGLQWRYDTGGNGGSLGLTAPPQKRIEFGGAEVALEEGATVDLSGGGDLQAIEWIPGTGGTRDLLSPLNTSYAGGGSGEQTPLYPDGRGVYAIVPGAQSPVAATDPVFDKSASPTPLGQSVYLSGVPGLPDGVYTLLPAKYATLPGAYRVVMRPGTQDATVAQNFTLPDGSVRVAGYFVDGLTGARDARSVQFEVQSRSVWGQYSEYTTTSANRFFSDLAAKNGKAVPQLARDAGQLILAATQALDLGARLKTDADSGGAAAQIDIASHALQVRDADHAALDGYVQLDVDDLNALGAGSLLIGGIREQTEDGTRINVMADSVVVSNDAVDPLHAPEILLTAGPAGSDGVGLRIDAGSAIEARGDLSASTLRPILIGREADVAKGITGISGDGALLRVSNAGEAPIIRANVPSIDEATGRLTVGEGAQLQGGASLTLDSTGDTRVSADAVLRGKAIAANAGRIRFDNSGNPTDTSGLVIGDNSLAQFANADRITLRSYSSMDFVGDVDLNIDKALTLSAGTFASDGGEVNLHADQLTIANELGAAGTSTAGSGTLNLGGREVIFGAGEASFAGFGDIDVNAGEAVIGRGEGTFDFGTLDVSVRAPVILADAGADTTLKTAGALHLLRGAGQASSLAPLGGALTFIGGSIDSDALIRANAGSIDLQATTGDVRLNAGSLIDVSGAEKSFFDTPVYVRGGEIGLTADKGTVHLAEGATLDFSSHAKGGDAGSLEISAPTHNAELLGTLKGDSAKGQGGSFGLDVGGAVDLDALSRQLAQSGVNYAVSVKTHAGNLELSENQTLVARHVSLIADGGADATLRDANNGNVIIDGTIDASGNSGGTIDLWGRHGVALNGTLLAKAAAEDQRGGAVTIGTSGPGNGTLNAEYGYQNVDAEAAGIIALGERARIDVSGGSAGGLSGGTVDFRAPLLVGGDVNVSVDDNATITGAREVGLEAYAVWSTTDASPDPAKHFDGIIDPAGWYDAQGNLVSGSWTDRSGNPVTPPTPAQLADYLSRYFFTPTTPNTNHSQFYGYLDEEARTPGTFMGFVQRPGFAFEDRFAHIANFRARPGVELRNPDAGINGGAISVLTSWNLGSGASRDALDYRYEGNAPILTLRADKNVNIKASISDGFFQLANPFGSGGPTAPYNDAATGYQSYFDFYMQNLGLDISPLLTGPGDSQGDSGEAMQFYAQYLELLALFSKSQPELGGEPHNPINLVDGFLSVYLYGIPVEQLPGQPSPPPAPTSPADYTNYLASYERYVLDLFATWSNTGFGNLPVYEPPKLPVLGPLLPGALYNTPTLQARIDNPLPLATASLIGGDSSRYRFVAGADMTSILPTAVRGDSNADVVLDGHRRHQEANQDDVLTPTTLRTGTGDIEIVAARDIHFADAVSPASIYAAGRPAEGTESGTKTEVLRAESPDSPDSNRTADVIVGAQANAEAAGDILLSAGRDILGNRQLFDVDGSLTGLVGNYVGQYWWPWLQVGNPLTDDFSALAAAQINFGGFAQGVMSVGGNIDVRAGRDIRELSVSLPTNYVPSAQAEGGRLTYGGGNLDVEAGRDVLGGDYFVAKGEGSLRAGGNLGSAFDLSDHGTDGVRAETSVAPVFALQNATWSIQSGGEADIGAIVNPSYLDIEGALFGFGNLFNFRADTAYSTDSAVDITAINGDVRLNTLRLPGTLFGYGARSPAGDDSGRIGESVFDNALPASLRAAALGGGLSVERGGRLYPSSEGQLELLANGDIALYNNTALPDTTLTMLDASANFDGNNRTSTRDDRQNLHRDDDRPVRIYSVNGDIVSGFESNGQMFGPLTLELPKPAQIRAGRDIVNLDLRGQNYYGSDITRVSAGRDLYYTPTTGGSTSRQLWIEIGGPGLLEVQAGRNLGPLNPYDITMNPAMGTGGIRTVGNRDNAGLPADGADISLRFGVGPGIATGAFASRYLDPAAEDTTEAYRDWLSEYMLRLENDRLRRDGRATLASMSPEDAWTAFERLSAEQQQPLVDRIFLDVLKRVGVDYRNPDSPYYNQYRRGYEAINTLFPAQRGYTANNLEGGENGAAQLVGTGDFDMRGSTVQTQRGGDIRVVGPGGGMLVGSVAAPPVITDDLGQVLIGPKDLGVLAMQFGEIGLFTDRSVQLAQSRVFTQRGGDLVMWSSNGDLNAGKGAKTSSEKPRNTYLCDRDHFCLVDARDQISGAGIAALQTDPDGKTGNAVLVAPRGTVDAGDAGIRVSGNLIIASQFVANADNIQVQGDTVGVPGARSVDTGALTAASSAASAVSDAATDLAEQRPPQVHDVPAVISVQVIGFGNCAPDDPRCKARQ